MNKYAELKNYVGCRASQPDVQLPDHTNHYDSNQLPLPPLNSHLAETEIKKARTGNSCYSSPIEGSEVLALF